MKGGWCGVLCVLNDADNRTGSQMVRMDGNILYGASANNPSRLLQWPGPTKGAPVNYSSLDAFKRAVSQQEVRDSEVVGPAPATVNAGAGARR